MGSGYSGLGDARRGTWDVGRGTWDVGRGTWDVGRGTWGLGDAGKRPNKIILPFLTTEVEDMYRCM